MSKSEETTASVWQTQEHPSRLHDVSTAKTPVVQLTGVRQSLLQMQRQYGNRHVMRLVERSRQVDDKSHGVPARGIEPASELSTYNTEIDKAQAEGAIPIYPKRAEKIKADGGYGHQLDLPLRREMERVLGADLGHVRVHTIGLAGEMLHASGIKGFAIGEHVFLNDQHPAPFSLERRVLVHELSHTLQPERKTALSLWDYQTHKQITEEVGGLLGMDKLFLGSLEESSDIMDVPLVRLILAGYRLLVDRPHGKVKPEGPDHGEGGWYKLDLGAAAAINIKQQTEYLKKALVVYREYASSKKEGTTRMFLRPLVQEMIDQLGNALHVAQDRGAHGEGAKGAGHFDPRKGYDPDDPRQNPIGLRQAEQNTFDVLSTFLAVTGLKEPRVILGANWIFVRRQYSRLKERLDYLEKQAKDLSVAQADIEAAQEQLRKVSATIEKDERSAAALAQAKSNLLIAQDVFMVPIERKLPAEWLKQPQAK